ncbi:DNA helicase [Ranunculus cassubicifolius]
MLTKPLCSLLPQRQLGYFLSMGLEVLEKLFLYRAILASLRKEGKVIIATATSGIAATILPGGQTAHSRFRLPLSPKPYSTCSISKQEDLAQFIRTADAIVWDEVTMIHCYTFEAFERTLRNIMDVDAPFGGKVVITGGDFRQLLPVVPRAKVREAIDACILKSSFWEKVITLRLKENMRARSDPSFSSFLLRVGNGAEPVLSGDMINIPSDMIIPWENESSLDTLIEEIFPNLSYNARNREYIAERALLTPLNDCVN